MSKAEDIQKPLLIQTGRGFSVLYQNKYLYSKYNPQAAVKAQCASLTIPDATILLCLSPLLGYGLEQVAEKLPPSSYMLALECDQQLMRLSLDSCDFSIFAGRNFSYIRADSIPEVLRKIETLPLFPFKKCMTVPLSGGVLLYKSFYDSVVRYVDELISRFWKNRITMMQLGRNYVHNTFRNLLSLGECTSDTSRICRFRLLKGTERINKPVLVVGAGPSLDTMRTFIRTYRAFFYLLAVDAAAPALLPDIRPDAIVLVESQFWIDSAFIGLKHYNIPVFADITASPRALKASGGEVCFFCTEYARLQYLTRLYRVLEPLVLKPLGSVGLAAVQIALLLTAPSLPVLHIGLDFAWGTGFTHAAGSSVVKKLFAETNRTKSLYELSVCSDMQHTAGEKGFSRTRPVLAHYAELYRHVFCNDARLVDLSREGHMLNSRKCNEEEAAQLLRRALHGSDTRKDVLFSSGGRPEGEAAYELHSINALHGRCPKREESGYTPYGCDARGSVAQYLAGEREHLTALEGHLTGQTSLPLERVKKILGACDYLYSHFPDAARGYSLEIGFLKRVSIELRYLLKLVC